MSKKLKKLLIRILIAITVLIIVAILDSCVFKPFGVSKWLRIGFYLIPYLIAGYDIIWSALKRLFRGGFLDENFLMTIATIGSFVIGEYLEASFVMLFFQIGEWFQKYAVGQSRKSIAKLMDIAPNTANKEENDQIIVIDPDEISVGDSLVIYPGEKVPVDGIIREGSTSLNTSALTGESAPLDVFVGDTIYSGSINISSPIKIVAQKAYADSTVKKILDLLENSSENKSKSENFITKFSRIYTPCVCGGALLVAIVGSLFSGDWQTWVQRALIFLVVSCPCALVISIPLSFFGGIGAASKQGVLIKGSSYLERLNAVKVFCFDKTGTLTKGNFAVTEIIPFKEHTKEEILFLACQCEAYSTHPIASSIREAFQKDIGQPLLQPNVSFIKEDPGKGIIYQDSGYTILCGNRKLMDENHISIPKFSLHPGTIIYIAFDGELAGIILLQDEIKNDAKDLVLGLKKIGVNKTIMLTGDNENIASFVAKELKIDECYAGLFPQDKVSIFSELNKTQPTAFVGDGLNDAPVLKIAEVGVAMGALGSDAAIEAADIVLMDDNPKQIIVARKIAAKTMSIVKENIIFALGVKLITLLCSAFGVAGMALAIFADVGVAVIAILNAMRCLHIKKDK